MARTACIKLLLMSHLVTFSDESSEVSREAIKTCNQMKHTNTSNKIRIHLCLNIAGNISDKASTQLNKNI